VNAGTQHDCYLLVTISLHFGPETKPPVGIGPTGASTEVLMLNHRNLLPRILVILRVVVKIIVSRR
jgi:hypothetical protein